jgi:hypothetical protein
MLNNKKAAMASDFPKIKSFVDAVYKRELLLNAVELHPDIDIIYHFPTLFDNSINSQKEKITPVNWCVAGSEALRVCHNLLKRAVEIITYDTSSRDEDESAQKLCQLLNLQMIPGLTSGQFISFVEKNMVTLTPGMNPEIIKQIQDIIRLHIKLPLKIYGDIQSNDTDLFFLGSPTHYRMKLSHTDLVHVTSTSIDDILLHFDLGCCRAAFNTHHDYWISAHCLYSLFTGLIFVPDYLKSFEMMNITVRKDKINHITYDCIHDNECDNLLERPIDTNKLYAQFQERVRKYELRGFSLKYYPTKQIAPWILSRTIY